MDRKISLIILFVIGVCAFEVSADEDHFKVPLEVREKNRPERLVDNADDPDMRALKEIQDKFFNIVGNSSAGKEFKSFKQLLHLVDSNAGIELGRLMFQGVMIAYGKDNSNQLLNEFIDDFQYRVSPELADSLIDYKDFLKTVDLKMIPLTIQTLFRKDELGNSLAQLPLGQLVDLVQPEASKYGIDIKAVINGILGKGDSTFPDIVKKLLDNFDVFSLVGNLTKPDTSETKEGAKESVEMKRQRKDPALMLFKPYISKLLKENNVDLDPDAVIQVLTPFVAPLIQSFMPSTAGKDGKQQTGNFDFTQLLPMITLLGSQLGESRGRVKKQEKLSEEELYESKKLEEKIDKKDVAGNALNMLTGLLEMSDNMKKGKIDETESGKEQELLQIAMSLLGNMGGKGNKDDSIANLMSLAAGTLQMSNNNGKKSEGPSANTAELLQLAMTMMGNLGNKKSEDDPMSNLLGLASSFMGNMGKQNGKDGNPMAGLLSLASSFMETNKDGRQPDLVQIITNILGGPNGKDIRSMVKLAAALFGTGKNKRRNTENLIDQSPEARKARSDERKKRLDEYKQSMKSDPRYLAAKKNVETVLKELKETENETISEDEGLEIKIVDKKDKKIKTNVSISEEDDFDRTKSFPYALEEFVAGIQSDEFVLSQLRQTFKYLKVFVATKFRTRQDFESYLTTLLLPYDKDLNVNALTTPFFLPDKQFGLFLDQLTKEQFSKNKLVTTATGEVLKKALDEKMTDSLSMILGHHFYSVISSMGIQGVTFDNFPEKLGVFVTVLSKTQNLPDDIDQLLSPLQYSLRAMMNWYREKIMKHSSLSEKELQELFVDSLYNEVVLPLKNLWKIRQSSKTTKSCFPRKVCEFVNKIDEDNVIETLVSQIGSIVFGGLISEREENPQIFIETVRASVYKGRCEKVFPATCEKKSTKKEDDDFQYEHIEL